MWIRVRTGIERPMLSRKRMKPHFQQTKGNLGADLAAHQARVPYNVVVKRKLACSGELWALVRVVICRPAQNAKQPLKGLRQAICYLFIKLKRFFASVEFQKTLFRLWNCFLLSVVMDGKDRHGLKLENLGQLFQVLTLSLPVNDGVLWGGSNFHVCGQNPMEWPFKWNLLGSTFMWCYLFLKILRNEIWDFCRICLWSRLAVKGLMPCLQKSPKKYYG